MTIYLNWEVEWGYGNTTPSPYNILSKWYVGKNNAPLFHPITTIERNYAIFAPSAFSCWHHATTTLIGDGVDFTTGDHLYFTAQQSGTAAAQGSKVKNTRVEIRWEFL